MATPATAVPAFFSELGRLRMLGGDRALDLANTRHWRDGRLVDFVPDYASLLRWAVSAGLLAEDELAPLLRAAAAEPERAAAVHRDWAGLRELFRMLLLDQIGTGRGDGAPGDPRAAFAAAANAALGGLRVSGAGPRLSVEKEGDGLALPLLRSGLALLSFVALPPRGTLRMCEADQCGGFFLDDSRSKPRRWCAMDSCGNRAKARRHREKHERR